MNRMDWVKLCPCRVKIANHFTPKRIENGALDWCAGSLEPGQAGLLKELDVPGIPFIFIPDDIVAKSGYVWGSADPDRTFVLEDKK